MYRLSTASWSAVACSGSSAFSSTNRFTSTKRCTGCCVTCRRSQSQGGHAKDVLASLGSAEEELRQGHVVCIFAEGSISRTGNLLPFKRGFERIIKGLRGSGHSRASGSGLGQHLQLQDGRFFWKWPRRLPYPVTVSFWRSIAVYGNRTRCPERIAELGAAAVEQRRTAGSATSPLYRDGQTPLVLGLHDRLHGQSAHVWEDVTGAFSSPTGCANTVPMTPWSAPPARLGGGGVGQYRHALAAKVPVNLNFTAGREAMTAALQHCAIHTIITSRAFLAKAKIDEREGMVYIEDVMHEITESGKYGPPSWLSSYPPVYSRRLCNRNATASRCPRHGGLLQW